MSKVRVIINYVDIAIALHDVREKLVIQEAATNEVRKKLLKLETILEDATKAKGAEFLHDRDATSDNSKS